MSLHVKFYALQKITCKLLRLSTGFIYDDSSMVVYIFLHVHFVYLYVITCNYQ